MPTDDDLRRRYFTEPIFHAVCHALWEAGVPRVETPRLAYIVGELLAGRMPESAHEHRWIDDTSLRDRERVEQCSLCDAVRRTPFSAES